MPVAGVRHGGARSFVLIALFILATGVVLAASPQLARAALIERVSLSSAGVESDSGSSRAVISADGRYIAFASYATNLIGTGNDTNNHADVFVRDRQTGQTTRVSVATGGAQATGGDSGATSISADGRYVAFESDATNLISGDKDSNGFPDVFVHDRQMATTTRVSIAPGGDATDGASGSPSISADGKYVAFQSDATNLVVSDTNEVRDVFVRDLQSARTVRVSVPGGGIQGNGASRAPAISSDGQYVAFVSGATNLVGKGVDLNGAEDVFVYDRQSDTTTRVSVATGGAESTGADNPVSISADGRYATFQSNAVNLVGGDTNGVRDIFVHDRWTGITQRVSVATGGAEGNAGSGYARISPDGRYVAFQSGASNLVSGDTNSSDDIFVRDMLRGTTRRVSVNSAGTEGNDYCGWPALSDSAGYAAFQSSATNLVSGDTNETTDIFVAANPVATIQHNEGGVTFERWVSGYNSAYSGGGYVYSPWAGSALEVRFIGTQIIWFGPKQPNYGKANVYIDGVLKGTVDCYASAATKSTQAVIWTSAALADGLHTLKIVPTGTKNASSTGTNVVVDRFEVEGAAAKAYMTRHDDETGSYAGSWVKGTNAAYIGGAYRYSKYPSASYTKTFNGTRVAWIGPKTGNYGRAKIYIDGVLKATVSQYGVMGWRTKVWESASLTPGNHTIKIVPTGTKDAASTNTIIVIDAIDVR